jgi:hypothetical protein
VGSISSAAQTPLLELAEVAAPPARSHEPHAGDHREQQREDDERNSIGEKKGKPNSSGSWRA